MSCIHQRHLKELPLAIPSPPEATKQLTGVHEMLSEKDDDEEEPVELVAPVEALETPNRVIPAPVCKIDKDVDVSASPGKLECGPPSLAGTVCVENLPFLVSGPLTLSDLEVYQENEMNHQRSKQAFVEELSKRRKAIAKKNDMLRDEFLSHYKPWRLNVWELDHGEEQKPSTPIPATPPISNPTPTPTPGAKGRHYKGNSELDFQLALKASELTAHQELDRRREKMAGIYPDLAKEAIVPDMLEPGEKEANVYKDANNIVDPSRALEVFGFLPPPDSFTEEEHARFTDAFMAYPKKWWKITEALPGRDFHECIMHYYMTKEEIKYKAKLNKRWSRRGRVKRSARPKSDALMVNLGIVNKGFDADEEPPMVTDTGRPRRAAAPTFAESSVDTENSPSGRRGHTAKDTDGLEKPAGRRGGRTGTGSRSGRRGKALHEQQQPQPQKPQLRPQQEQTASSKLPATATVPAAAVPEAKVEQHTGAAVAQTWAHPDKTSQEQSHPRNRPGPARARESVYVLEPDAEVDASVSRQSVETGYGSLQPTSHWSFHEQRGFPLLLGHFGRDFEGISNFMKTKTTAMVKNHFQGLVDSGHSYLTDCVRFVEARKARGVPTGPLPRKIPIPGIPRPMLAPQPEVSAQPDGRLQEKDKASSVLPSQTVSMHLKQAASEKDHNPTRYLPLAQATTTPVAETSAATTPPNDEPPRAARPNVELQQPFQGPHLGYVTEERREPTVLDHSATSRNREMQVPPRQESVSEPREESIGPIIRPSLDTHASSVLPVQRAGSLSQQAFMQQQRRPWLTMSASRLSMHKVSTSPTRLAPDFETNASPLRHDDFGRRQYFGLIGQHGGVTEQQVVSPSAAETTQPLSTPSQVSETPRQVPAKRSNLVSILNDEPEDPQPRKRLASERVASASAVPPSRPNYTGSSPRDVLMAREKAISLFLQRRDFQRTQSTQPSQQIAQSRSNADYGGYPSVQGTSSARPNNDWVGGFDSRGHRQQRHSHSQSHSPYSQQLPAFPSNPPTGTTMVSGAHQQHQTPHHRTTANSAGPASGHYTLGRPPAPTQIARGLNILESQPPVLRPNPTPIPSFSNLAYVAGRASSTAGPVRSPHQRHPGPGTLTDSGPGPRPPFPPSHRPVLTRGASSIPGSMNTLPPR